MIQENDNTKDRIETVLAEHDRRMTDLRRARRELAERTISRMDAEKADEIRRILDEQSHE